MWEALGSILAPVVGGLYGQKQAEKDRKAAQKQRDEAAALFDSLGIPSIASQELKLDKYNYLGDLTPEQEIALQLQDTALKDIAIDPKLRAAQMAALEELQNIGSEGGLTDIDRARLNSTLTEIDNRARGQREAQIQNMRQRGVSGSGMELAAELQNQADSASRGYQAGLDMNAMAQQRALDAIMNAGQLGGQIRAQDYGEQSEAARAQDLINQFNVQNSQSVQSRNVQANNQAQQRNLDTRQNLSNSNVDLSNQQQIHNKGLIQQDFQNRYNVATGKSNALTGNANANDQRANQTQNLWAGLGSTLGAGIAKYGQQELDKDKR